VVLLPPDEPEPDEPEVLPLSEEPELDEPEVLPSDEPEPEATSLTVGS
jgi:hypothetical protein